MSEPKWIQVPEELAAEMIETLRKDPIVCRGAPLEMPGDGWLEDIVKAAAPLEKEGE